jgi:uncharacterized protein YecE (DUF72 family)
VVAVEFRNRSWFGEHTEETLRFLKEQGLTYVSIDGPRSRATVPSLPALTSPTAVFRLHGRNFEGHLKQLQGNSPTVAEKYDYLYTEKELEEIARAAGALNGKAERVHLAMNTTIATIRLSMASSSRRCSSRTGARRTARPLSKN